MTGKPKLYLAGPEVFLPDAIEIGRIKKDLCARYGIEGLYPFDNEVSPRPGEAVDRVIYRANIAMIRDADGGIFNLTPFRGPSADVGTVFELGSSRPWARRLSATRTGPRICSPESGPASRCAATPPARLGATRR